MCGGGGGLGSSVFCIKVGFFCYLLNYDEKDECTINEAVYQNKDIAKAFAQW